MPTEEEQYKREWTGEEQFNLDSDWTEEEEQFLQDYYELELDQLSIDPATNARNTLLSVLTAARNGDVNLASTIVGEFANMHNGDILPLLISSLALIETILLSIASEIGIDADKLFSGICLGLSVRQIEEQGEEPA